MSHKATDNNADSINPNQRWVILAIIYVSILAFAIVMQSIPPVLSLVMAEFNLSHAQGGLLMSFFALPGIILSIAAGILADRYNQKLIGIISLAMIIAGTIIFLLGNSLSTLALGRVVSGIGAATLQVVILQLVAQWFAGREIGIALGVSNTGVPLGTVLSLTLLSLLSENQGWRFAIGTSIVLPVVALVLFAFFYAPAPQKSHQITDQHEGFLHSLRLTGTPVWIVAGSWGLFNAAMISLFTFTPDFLTATGFSIGSSGFITSMTMWPSLALSVVVGYIIDKIDRKRGIIAVGGLALVILILMVPEATGWIVLSMLLIGIAQTLVPSPIFALIAELSEPKRLGLSYGITATCLNLGVLIGPYTTGLINDIIDSYQASYALMSGFAFLVVVAMIILKYTRK